MGLRIALRNTLKIRDLAAKMNVLKEEFISKVTHELRTAFTSIRKSLGLINTGVMGEVPKAFKEPLEIVDPNTMVLLNLRNELSDVQKLNSGHIEYDFKPVVIGDLIKEICINIWGIANELKIQIFFLLRSSFLRRVKLLKLS